jgi:hypothetical protein
MVGDVERGDRKIARKARRTSLLYPGYVLMA